MPKAAQPRLGSPNAGPVRTASGKSAPSKAAAKRRAPARSFEELAGDGWVTRLTDRIIENPAQSGGIVVIVAALVAIVSNAAFLQRAHHPDPFFITRPQAAAAGTPANSGVPLPRSRADATQTAAPATAETTLISETQRALASAKLFDGPADGVLGPATKAAIANFEKKLGLSQTGLPSPRLLIQIRKGTPHADIADPATTGSVEDPATRARTKLIQEALNRLGYGPVDSDGRNGGKTATAIRRFELDNGLGLTGVASDAVMAKLVMIGAINPS